MYVVHIMFACIGGQRARIKLSKSLISTEALCDPIFWFACSSDLVITIQTRLV